MTNKVTDVLAFLHKDYENSFAGLDFSNDYECLVAIVLSAQTTDKSVNKISPTLFSHFPTFEALGNASIEEIEQDIKTLGLYHNKAKSIKALGQVVTKEYGGILPNDRKTLTTLPGVGVKTAGVFLLERRGEQLIPVDTHVKRIAIRLGFAGKNDDFVTIEKKLERAFPKEEHAFIHHSVIMFGRTRCLAINPDCEACPLKQYCSFYKKNSSTKGR
ncbi:MAG: endonuclease III [Bacilli bacterium]|nr:endonuclease III [Bacilli bacterium]